MVIYYAESLFALHVTAWPSCRYVGTRGVYSHTVAYERDTECIVCSPGLPVHIAASTTLQQARDE